MYPFYWQSQFHESNSVVHDSTFIDSFSFAQSKEIIKADKAPVPITPYNQGIKANGFLFEVGQICLIPSTRKLVEGGVEAETTQIMENIQAILMAVGARIEHIVSTTIYLKIWMIFRK